MSDVTEDHHPSLGSGHARPIPAWVRLRDLQAAGQPADRLAVGSPTLKLLVVAIALTSCGNFNPMIFAAPDAIVETGQKVIGAGLWLTVIAATFLPGMQRRPSMTQGLMLPLLLVVWAVSSLLWSHQPASTAEKVLVIAFTSFGTWRLSACLQCEEMFQLLFVSLLGLVLASIMAALLVPSIGVLSTWQHAGQWAGVFVSKQTLGQVSALLVFLSMLRLCHAITPVSVLGLVAGIVAVIGAGSRGGAAMAFAAVVCIMAARRSARLAALVSYLPFAALALASFGIAFIAAADLPYIPVFGTEINLTDRTVIWHYGLTGWLERPLLGYGIQGFWSDPALYEAFRQAHGWVLDNFHSGYVSLMVEQGLLGYVLFAGFVLLLCRRLRESILAAPSLPLHSRFSTEAIFGYVILSCTINLTETFFFRATDFMQIMMIFSTIFLFAARPAGDRAGPWPQRESLPS